MKLLGDLKQVLVVDDQPITRKAIVRLIRNTGLFGTISEASNGIEALAVFETEKPDLVITDIVMPEMDGIELINAIKQRNPFAKIIALTAHVDKSIVTSAMTNGAYGFIYKSDSVESILFGIKEVARGNRYISPRATEGFKVDAKVAEQA